jgi:hypothetical protein
MFVVSYSLPLSSTSSRVDGKLGKEKGGAELATEFCQRCKQSHPGRVCDYDDKGECAETVNLEDSVEKKISDGMTESDSSLDRAQDHKHP